MAFMQRFFRVEAVDGGWLADCPTSGRVISVAEADLVRGSHELFLFVSERQPEFCFLIGRHGPRLRLQPDVDGPGAIGLGLVWKGATEASLCHTPTGLWVGTSSRCDLGSVYRDVAADRDQMGAAEVFKLHDAIQIFISQDVIDKAAKIEAALGGGLDANNLPGEAFSFEICASLLTGDRLERLAVEVAASREASSRLSRLFPDDVMGRHGLVNLANWQSARDNLPPKDTKKAGRGWFGRIMRSGDSERGASSTPASADTRRLVIAPELDSLASLGYDGRCATLLHKLNCLARLNVVPRKDVCVIATARNEGLYLLEWVAYHRALGVDAIFLYTNDSDDGSEQLAYALHAAGAIRWVKSAIAPGGKAQPKAYGHALSISPEVLEYRWALVVDIDEYFMFDPESFGSMKQFLSWHESHGSDAIALNWVMFGPSGQSHWHDDFIGRRFPFASGLDHHIKTICKPRQFMHSTPHHPVSRDNAAFRFNNAAGMHHKAHRDGGISLADEPSQAVAWINHYFYKSAEEFLWKWSRNRGDGPILAAPSKTVLERRFIEMFIQNYRTQTVLAVTPEHCAPRFTEELSALEALDGVREAVSHIKRVFRDRMDVIAPMFVDAPGIREAGPSGVEFLGLFGLAPVSR